MLAQLGLHAVKVIIPGLQPLNAGHQRRVLGGRRLYQMPVGLGLSAREKLNPIQLSGGEQQRVAIARAVANRPSVLLADEPTANLDADSAASIMQIFLSFQQVGVTVLIATHDLALVERSGKRVLKLELGRLVEGGDPA